MKFCSNCGKPISEGSKFCSECGFALPVAATPAPVPAPAPAPVPAPQKKKKTGLIVGLIAALLVVAVTVVGVVWFIKREDDDTSDSNDKDDEKTMQTEKADATGPSSDTSSAGGAVSTPVGDEVTDALQGGDVTTAPQNQQGTAAPGEIVVVDNEHCTIKLLGHENNSLFGYYKIKVEATNKSTDKEYDFMLNGAAINNVECGGSYYVTVSPGKKAIDYVTFFDFEIKEYGITDYTDIELSFGVVDSEDWYADDICEATVHYYPQGQDKAVQHVRPAMPTDNVIMDNDYATVTVTGYENDEFLGYTVKLYIVNKTDREICINADNVSVNGYMVDPLFVSFVGSGKFTFEEMYWSDDDFKENNITAVKSIEFDLTVEDWDDFDFDTLAEAKVTLNP